MAIKISRVKNDRGVAVGSLLLGDTFLFDNRVGVIAARNGHQFPLDLTTCAEFLRSSTNHIYNNPMLSPDTIVLPVSVELTYKVAG